MHKFLPFLFIPTFFFACSSQQEPEPGSPKTPRPGAIEFFETYETAEINDSWEAACRKLKEIDSLENAGDPYLQQLPERNLENLVRIGTLNSFGYVYAKDVSAVKLRMERKEFKELFPKDLEFMWSYALEETPNNQKMYALYAVKVSNGGEAIINGKDIRDARSTIGQQTGQPVINLSMTKEGSTQWRNMTRKNINRYIAITTDKKVLSCPKVTMEISGGETEINGNFTMEEAQNLASQMRGER